MREDILMRIKENGENTPSYENVTKLKRLNNLKLI